jgi:hypothetical protein
MHFDGGGYDEIEMEATGYGGKQDYMGKDSSGAETIAYSSTL